MTVDPFTDPIELQRAFDALRITPYPPDQTDWYCRANPWLLQLAPHASIDIDTTHVQHPHPDLIVQSTGPVTLYLTNYDPAATITYTCPGGWVVTYQPDPETHPVVTGSVGGVAHEPLP